MDPDLLGMRFWKNGSKKEDIEVCVICIADNHKRPSKKMVGEMWDKNDHGAGIAWRETDKDGKVWVHWRKGLNKEQMIKLCAELPLPYVAHFRLASTSGGDKRDELTHPFEINQNPSEALEGKTDGWVLFHNGDWKEWGSTLLSACLRYGYQLPAGKISDTRAMAFLSSILGVYFMDFIGQKGVTFGPEEYEIGWGSDGWKNIGGLLCSNDKFVSYARFSGYQPPLGTALGPYTSQNPTLCRGKGCGNSVGATDYGFCSQRHSHMRPVPRLLSPAQEKKAEICMECSALLGTGQKHEKDCSQNPEKLGAKVGKIVCQVCKEALDQNKKEWGHKPDCTVKEYGMVVEMGPAKDKESGTLGGGPIPDPFHVVLKMEDAYKEGKFGRKAFKRIAERWGFGNGLWQIEKELREKKDHHITKH